jgi:F-type H+-transporting ATPase subunit b
MARAEAAIRQADARAQEYEAKLRTARAEIFHAREQRMQAMQRERERVLEETRHAAHERVRVARAALEREAADARATLDGKADSLAAEILRVIVPSAAAAGAVSGHTTGSVY